MHNALLAAEKYGMETVQVFTKNQQQWKCSPLSADSKSFSGRKDPKISICMRDLPGTDSWHVSRRRSDQSAFIDAV